MLSKELTEAAIEARRAYKRRWNAENPDKVREHQRRYWERKAKADSERQELAESGKDGQVKKKC